MLKLLTGKNPWPALIGAVAVLLLIAGLSFGWYHASNQAALANGTIETRNAELKGKDERIAELLSNIESTKAIAESNADELRAQQYKNQVIAKKLSELEQQRRQDTESNQSKIKQLEEILREDFCANQRMPADVVRMLNEAAASAGRSAVHHQN